MAKNPKARKKRIGQLPPRYSFAINPYKDARFSKCPKCDKATYPRKFPLLIYIDDFGPIVLGKTCRYCSKCEFIIAHQNELEHELTVMCLQRASGIVGNNYFVIGTVENKAWRQNLDKKQGTLEDVLPYTADIKKYMTLYYEPAAWVPKGETES